MKNKIPVIAVAAVALASVAWNPSPAWAEDSLVYRHMDRLLLALSHCQVAESTLKKGLKHKGNAALVGSMKQADVQLKSAQDLLATTPQEERRAFNQQIKAVEVAIRYLRTASRGFVEITTGEQPFVDTPEYRDYVRRLSKALDEGWGLLLGATMYQSLILIDPAAGEDLMASVQFRIPRHERQQLVHRIDKLFGREIKALRKEMKRGKRGKTSFRNVTLTALYLREILEAGTYQELGQIREKLFNS